MANLIHKCECYYIHVTSTDLCYVFICGYMYVCMHLQVYVWIYVCMYLVVNVHMYVCSCNYICIPSFLEVSDFGCGINPFLRRQIMMDSAMLAEANSRATTRNSIAIIFHADCPAASSTKG